eukprot:TRINITY_DN29329_c0_g1_i8.p1 TRINITY_DN29329_c0_g1~~TRINITY_DN29329_c0_g1_i8.p1  ORF type:complete len:498 (-),score=101.54 TRINITY_DN29329_c0_g1_i8:406-1899(-)
MQYLSNARAALASLQQDEVDLQAAVFLVDLATRAREQGIGGGRPQPEQQEVSPQVAEGLIGELLTDPSGTFTQQGVLGSTSLQALRGSGTSNMQGGSGVMQHLLDTLRKEELTKADSRDQEGGRSLKWSERLIQQIDWKKEEKQPVHAWQSNGAVGDDITVLQSAIYHLEDYIATDTSRPDRLNRLHDGLAPLCRRSDVLRSALARHGWTSWGSLPPTFGASDLLIELITARKAAERQERIERENLAREKAEKPPPAKQAIRELSELLQRSQEQVEETLLRGGQDDGPSACGASDLLTLPRQRQDGHLEPLQGERDQQVLCSSQKAQESMQSAQQKHAQQRSDAAASFSAFLSQGRKQAHTFSRPTTAEIRLPGAWASLGEDAAQDGQRRAIARGTVVVAEADTDLLDTDDAARMQYGCWRVGQAMRTADLLRRPSGIVTPAAAAVESTVSRDSRTTGATRTTTRPLEDRPASSTSNHSDLARERLAKIRREAGLTG